jgi:DNA repair photolyase
MIYEPSGKAREYSPLAANLYSGCNHGCLYCFAPGIARKSRGEYLYPVPVNDAVRNFERDAVKFYGGDKWILFSFMSDPYNNMESSLMVTRRCLEIAIAHRLKIKILTKSALVIRDIDLFKKLGEDVKVGMTLTFSEMHRSVMWEPGAALPAIRLAVLRQLHDAGIRTWASFEPVLFPEESIDMIQRSISFVDEYKIGKINNYEGWDKTIDWPGFLTAVLDRLRGVRPLYVKDDLAAACPGIKLLPEERVHE